MRSEWWSDALATWVRGVSERAGWVLVALAILTALSAWIAADRFRINSDLNGLIDQSSEWRGYFDDYKDTFPDLVNTAVVVVHGTSLADVEDTARAIEARVRSNDAFRAVSAPQIDPFLRDHALLFMDLDELDDMADRLAEAQPVLTAVAEDASLRGVVSLVVDSFENDASTAGLDRLLRLLRGSVEAREREESGRIRWADELFEVDGAVTRVISLKGRSEQGETLRNAAILTELRSVLGEVEVPDDVQIYLTGEVALEHEEIQAALSGVQIAGWLSLLILVIVMAVGVRSVKIILASIALLVCGVVMTTAWALVSVGEFNTLSLVFIVMFFGLGIDFALHFSLRYQEAINREATIQVALERSVRSVGRAISICTLTTALAFLCFWPTDYQGLADLGVISAGGMVIAAFLTFTLLPALYTVMGPIRPHEIDLPTGDRLVSWLVGHRKRVVVAMLALALGGGYLASDAYFDYSVLALRDQSAESMRALRLLQEEEIANDYVLSVLHDDAPDWVADVEAIESVDHVLTAGDYVPSDQADKLFVLEDLQQLLWSAIEPQRELAPPTAGELRSQLAQAAEILRSFDAKDAKDAQDAQGYAQVFERASAWPDDQLMAWQDAVLDDARVELEWLRRALFVEEIRLNDLPSSLTDRLFADDGRRLSVVFPAGDVSSTAALKQYVEDVRAIVPQATGRPVIEWGVGAIVQRAFFEALIAAFLIILVVLALVFRSPKDAVLIMLPLSLAALFTLAFGVLADQPINMASVLVIPLIFGLGVDNGIHVFDRYRRAGDVSSLLHSSTPRAVMLSTLTTIAAFASLMLSPHAGTASIGMLLAVAVGLLLIFTVFLLPVLLHKP